MSDKVLFILAGYSGVGKSTLLKKAIEKKLPIFGKTYDHLFQSIKLPPRHPEECLTFDEILDSGTWFSGLHFKSLAQSNNLPEHLLISIDLLALSTQNIFVNPHDAATFKYLPRTLENLADDKLNELFMKRVLTNDFFQKFNVVIVNTLYAQWHVNARRWLHQQSKGRLSGSQKEKFFDFNRPLENIHTSIYSSWIRSINLLKPTSILLSEFNENRLKIRELKGGS